MSNQTHYTIKQLRDIAKERKIKYFKTYKKNELEKMLGLELSKPNEKFEKYCREKMKNPKPIIIINKQEKLSILKAFILQQKILI